MIERRKNMQDKHLNALMDASPNLIMISDGKTIFSANKSLLNFLGFKSWEAFLEKHKYLSNLFICVGENALLAQMGEQTWIEYLLEHPNKKLAHMYKGKDLHIFKTNRVSLEIENTHIYAIIFTDITEIKLEKERYTQTIEGSHASIWDWNLQSNTIYFSAYWKEILVHEEDELKNEYASWKEKVYQQDLEQVMQDIQNNIDNKTKFYRYKAGFS